MTKKKGGTENGGIAELILHLPTNMQVSSFKSRHGYVFILTPIILHDEFQFSIATNVKTSKLNHIISI
jgi:hypothetical protein